MGSPGPRCLTPLGWTVVAVIVLAIAFVARGMR